MESVADRASIIAERAADTPLDGRPAFLLACDLRQGDHAWPAAEGQARAVASSCTAMLGFDPLVRPAALEDLSGSIGLAADGGASEVFVIPAAFDLNLLQREMIGRAIGEARRVHPHIAVYHDDADVTHPLVVDCLAGQVLNALEGARPDRMGLIVAASGHGDATGRAQTYALMRLVWERLGFAAAEVGFVRHDRPFLLATLEACEKRELEWIVVPQMLWRNEHFEYVRVILDNFQRTHSSAARWRVVDPPEGHPVITALMTQRIARLWRGKRERERTRVQSPKRSAPVSQGTKMIGSGTIASVSGKAQMREIISGLIRDPRPARVLVKVTWHGYATGTYTDPAALDLLLGSLPGPAVILEGHTSSRNLGGAPFEWENEARENRAWIRQQDAEYLRRTGLADVLARHGAQYVNITEAFWDGACADSVRIGEILRQRDVTLQHTELMQFVPEVLLDYLGCPLISFAKFKGPTRLSIANMFGLLPEPLRAALHGPNITYMARVCCGLARLYGAMFELYGINEALFSAVRWDRQGLYRSRWGNYDLIHDAGLLTTSPGLVSADILASRLQGQDVNRSAFFDVVRSELGWDEEAAQKPLQSVFKGS